MGNNNSSDHQVLQRLVEESKEVGRLVGSPYGTVMITADQKEQRLYAVKTLQRDVPQELIQKYQRCQSERLVRMVGSYSQRVKGMCTGAEVITTAVYELDGSAGGQSPKILTLANQLQERKTKSSYMAQDMMVGLLQDCLDALVGLEIVGVPLPRITPQMLLISSTNLQELCSRSYKLCPILELFELQDKPTLSILDSYCRKLDGQSKMICYLGFVMLECCTHKQPEGFLVRVKSAVEVDQVFAKEDEVAKALVAHKSTTRDFKSLVKRMVCQNTLLTSMNYLQLLEALNALDPQTEKKRMKRKSLERDEFIKEFFPVHGKKDHGQTGKTKQETHQAIKPPSLSTDEQSTYAQLRKTREPYLISQLYSPRRKRKHEHLP